MSIYLLKSPSNLDWKKDNKLKIINFSILALSFCAPQVMAEGYDFYGRLDYSVTHSDSGSATHNNKSGTVLENNFSLLGVKGSSPLTDTVSIFYQIEMGVNSGSQDNTDKPFSARPTFLGVKHDNFGALALGRIDPVFKMAKGTSDAMDMYAMKHDRLFAGDKRWGDSLEYKSTRWNHLQLGVSYLMEDNYYSETDNRRDNGNYQLALTYGDKHFKIGKWYVAAAYSDGVEDIEAYRAVLQYKWDKLQLSTMLQHSELVNTDKPDWQQREGNGFILSAKYQLDRLLLKAQYGQDDSGTGLIANRIYASKTLFIDEVPDVSQWALGAEYKLSKSARLHSEIGQFDVKQYSSFDDTIVSIGMRYDF
ncbi:porin [Shewanella glacialipiscicola]|uniref:porin n=1 Tax=Shewanella glacialipiscicola TaxID=614069 RepID=UPI003D78FEA1